MNPQMSLTESTRCSALSMLTQRLVGSALTISRTCRLTMDWPETIFQETKTVVEKDLNFAGFSAFGSDGCNTMIGKKSGVTTRLKAIKPELITIHRSNHRLALAAKDSFEGIPIFRDIDDTLSHLFKYYKNSLEKIQKLLDEGAIRKIKSVAHTRCYHT